MDRPLRACTVVGCGGLTRSGGPCALHPYVNGHRKTYDAEWDALARQILRLHPTCQVCVNAPASEVDHIVAVRAGGSRLARANLRALCHPCHMLITAQTRAHPPTPKRRR